MKVELQRETLNMTVISFKKENSIKLNFLTVI